MLAQYTYPVPGLAFIQDEVPRVDIFLPRADRDKIFEDIYSDEEYAATFVYSTRSVSDTLHDVGFRLRGNTSRNARKKSFKISFNGFVPGRKFEGLEKMNLNGEHNDPSIMRSKIAWDLCHRLEIPSSRSNHVALYINTEYYGVYINVEHVDEEFIQKRFSGKRGNLYKCLYPADLNYKGHNPAVYKEEVYGRRAYDLKTNTQRDNYNDLAHFINVINNYVGLELQCELERIFDVDTYLKTIVMDVLIANWDGPIVNKNNFYLYTDSESGRMTYIPYDLDNTFGIDWFGVDWADTDIYQWSEISEEDRPIYETILGVPEYRDRYTYYMHQTLEQYFNVTALYTEVIERKDMINPYRQNDPFAGQDYGWSYNDFLRSFDEPLGGHVTKGIIDYIGDRTQSAEAQLEDNLKVIPYAQITKYAGGDNIRFDIHPSMGSDITELTFHYSINRGLWQMHSLDPDINTYDFPYTDIGEMTYYFTLSNADGYTRDIPLCQDAKIQLGYRETADVVINELMASNEITHADDAGEFDDWIEIYNNDVIPAPIFDYYLTDDPTEPNKWKLPNTILNPGQYMIIWADGEPSQGEKHTNFKLKKSGEFLGLFDGSENNFAPIDTFHLPAQETDLSYARVPNGTGEFVTTEAVTVGYNNDQWSSTIDEEKKEVEIFPVPVYDILYIGDQNATYDFTCYSSYGQQIKTYVQAKNISVADWLDGLYYLVFSDGRTARFMITK